MPDFIPQTDWPTIDLTRAAGLAKTATDSPAGKVHRFHDRRTGQSFGPLGVFEAGRMGIALARLRGLHVA